MPECGLAISRALQVNEIEKHTAAIREHVEQPYKSRILPTIGERGYCPIMPLRGRCEGFKIILLIEVLTPMLWSSIVAETVSGWMSRPERRRGT
jgi:hypothetical protein